MFSKKILVNLKALIETSVTSQKDLYKTLSRDTVFRKIKLELATRNSQYKNPSYPLNIH